MTIAKNIVPEIQKLLFIYRTKFKRLTQTKKAEKLKKKVITLT